MKIDEVRELENEILKRLNRAYMSPLDHGRLTLALLREHERRCSLCNTSEEWIRVERIMEEM